MYSCLSHVLRVKKRLTWTGFLCCGFYRGRLSWFGCLYSWCGGFCGWKHIINNLILTQNRMHFHSNKSLFLSISNEIPFHFNYKRRGEHKLCAQYAILCKTIIWPLYRLQVFTSVLNDDIRLMDSIAVG